MSGLIKNTIGPSAFELIRDRIGEILTTELGEQYTQSANALFNDVNVWLERIAPFEIGEFPAINVQLSNGSLSGHTMPQTDGRYTYHIDIWCRSAGSNDAEGDKLATLKLHKLLGVCRNILESSFYPTLGFAAPFIAFRGVQDILIAENAQETDGGNVVRARIVYMVEAPETHTLKAAVDLANYTTQVKLYETNYGYLFSGSEPEPDDEPTATLYATKTCFTGTETIGLAWFTTDANSIDISGIGAVQPTGQTEVEVTAPALITLIARNVGHTVTSEVAIITEEGMKTEVFTSNGTSSQTVTTLVDKDLKHLAVEGGGFYESSQWSFKPSTGTITWSVDSGDLISGLKVIAFYL